MLLLNLSAAFDTIYHSILLKKLKEDYTIGGTELCWFRSYLENISFTVTVSDKNSSPGILWFGVPQGSLVGPILFILYTKELSNIARKHGLQIQFMQMIRTFRLVSKRDRGLDVASPNFMKLNKEKTRMIFPGNF